MVPIGVRVYRSPGCVINTDVGKDAAEIRREFHPRLGEITRELKRVLYPEGLPRGTKFSELEAIAGAIRDEMARQLIELSVQEQADDWPRRNWASTRSAEVQPARHQISRAC
jgi:hypothetical protein